MPTAASPATDRCAPTAARCQFLPRVGRRLVVRPARAPARAGRRRLVARPQRARGRRRRHLLPRHRLACHARRASPARVAHNLFAIAQQRRSPSATAPTARVARSCCRARVGRLAALRRRALVGRHRRHLASDAHPATPGLTAGLCGIPLWGCDVGGFRGDPAPEAVRALDAAGRVPAAIPRARHTLRPRAVVAGDEAMRAMTPALRLRGALLPSIYTWAVKHSAWATR